jgi:hypothetical protein
MLNVAGFFVAFAIGAALAVIPQVRAIAARHPLATSLVMVVTFTLVIQYLPFHGYLTELPIIVLAALALAPAMSFVLSQKTPVQPGRRNIREVVTFAISFAGLGFVFLGSGGRFFHADQLMWECDGNVQQVYRKKGNHNLPAIDVSVHGEVQTFINPADEVFAAAKPGMHLIKKSGTAFATLDGQRVRMVRPGNFAHDDGD